MTNHSMKNLFLGSLRRKQTVVRIISLILFVSVISFVLFEGTKKTVTFEANGEVKEVATHAKTVEEFLQNYNIDVAEHDELSPSLSTKIANGIAITWEQAKEITISVDGKQSKVWTTEKLVKNILEEANIEVSEHDEVAQDLDAKLGSNNKIDIQKAFQVTFVDGKETRQVWSTSTTVANFLKQQEIQLNELDRVENNLEEVITPESKIAVVRVEKVIDVVEDSLDFPIEKKNDSSLLKGKEKVITAGEKGIVSRTYEVVKENGEVVAKNLQSEKVIQEPTKQVVAVGTKAVVASASTVSRGSEPAGGKEFYVTATAYTPYCDGCSGTSATGINLRANAGLKVIAVDPSVIKLGSKVWVEGYGTAIAGDTGGAIKGNKIDILVQSDAQARNWGRKKVRVKVLN